MPATNAASGLIDDLTGTIFAGRHQPLRVWLAYLHLRGRIRYLGELKSRIGRVLILINVYLGYIVYAMLNFIKGMAQRVLLSYS